VRLQNVTFHKFRCFNYKFDLAAAQTENRAMSQQPVRNKAANAMSLYRQLTHTHTHIYREILM